MATVIRVPALGAGIANINIIRWAVVEGGSVEQGETLLEVETDKMNMEIPAERSGVLRRVFLPVGAETSEGVPLAIIGEADEDIEPLAADLASELGLPSAGEGAAHDDQAVASEPGKARVSATPVARRVAKELGVDLALVAASNPRGTVSEADVRRHHEQLKAVVGADADVEVIPLVGRWKTIADRMLESTRASAHYTMEVEVDCGALVELRAELRETFERTHGTALTYVPFFVKALGRAVRDVPIANASVVGNEIHVKKTPHVGVAVAVEDSILVPVVRDANSKSIEEIAVEVARLTSLARDGGLTPADTAGGTITLTNMGVTEVRRGTTILNQPQVAIVAVTRISDRVVAVDGKVMIRPMLNVMVTYDHRVVQGVPGARFAERVKEYLERPHELAHEGNE